MAITDRVVSFLNSADGASSASVGREFNEFCFIKQLFADECIMSCGKKEALRQQSD
jgi:hypothetical protein